MDPAVNLGKPKDEKSRNTIDKPHDALFQGLLSDPLRSQSVLQAHLERWTLELLADELPVPLDPSFVDQALRRSQSDKLLQVTLKDGEPGYVYALLEHKSYPDAGTALQISTYKSRIWERYAQGRASRLRALPTIIPVVFYHGEEEWTAPMSIREMLRTRDERSRKLEPALGYYLRDLRRIPAEQLASDRAARAGLIALRHSHARSQDERLRELPEVVAGPRSGSEYEKQVFMYLMNIWGIASETLGDVAEVVKPRRGKAVVGQIVQELIDRGKAQGLTQGLIKGEAKGLIKGEAKGEARGLIKGEAKGLIKGEAKGLAGALTRLLERRFGMLPRAVRRWIATAPASELDARFIDSLDAKSLAEVFPGLDWN